MLNVSSYFSNEIKQDTKTTKSNNLYTVHESEFFSSVCVIYCSITA